MLQLKNKVILLVALGSAALMGVWGCSKPGGTETNGSNVNPPPEALYPVNVTLKMDNPQPGTQITLQNNASDDLIFSDSDLRNGIQKSFHTAFPANWAYAVSVSNASPAMVKCDFTPASFGNVKSEPVNITGTCAYDAGAPAVNMAAEHDGSRDFSFSLSDPNSFRQQNVTLKFNITTTPSKKVVINIDNTKPVTSGWDMTVIGNRDPNCDDLKPGVWCKITVKGITVQTLQKSGSFTVPFTASNAYYDPATTVIKYTIKP